MDSPLPLILESADCDGPGKPKDRLVNLLDEIEVHVDQLRKDAWRLEEEKDILLTTLDTLKNNDILEGLEEPDRDDVLRYAERLTVRCLTVDVLVKVQRDQIQQEALHQTYTVELQAFLLSAKKITTITSDVPYCAEVNELIDNLIVGLRDDPTLTRQRCTSFMNACSSHGYGLTDKTFETAILGCTMEDQKRIKKRLQGLLDYIDKMHTIQLL